MKTFVASLPRHIAASFIGRFVWFHILAIILTTLIVLSGFDWWYFVVTHSTLVRTLSFPAVLLGSFLPIVLPVCIIVIARMRKDRALQIKGWMVGQAALIGLIISSCHKAITGRVQPPFSTLTDTSLQFNFGFLRHGIFWGWPSSHTTTSFALAFAFFSLFPQSKWRWVVLLYALYVGLGVSTTIHWFSEFAAGALIGAAIGMAVGKSVKARYLTNI